LGTTDSTAMLTILRGKTHRYQRLMAYCAGLKRYLEDGQTIRESGYGKRCWDSKRPDHGGLRSRTIHPYGIPVDVLHIFGVDLHNRILIIGRRAFSRPG